MITRQNALHTVTSVVNELYDRYETEHEALGAIVHDKDRQFERDLRKQFLNHLLATMACPPKVYMSVDEQTGSPTSFTTLSEYTEAFETAVSEVVPDYMSKADLMDELHDAIVAHYWRLHSEAFEIEHAAWVRRNGVKSDE